MSEESFLYQLVMRGALTQEELDLIKKYKVMNAWLYSNREERESQKEKLDTSSHWTEMAAASWHNAGIEPLLEITMENLLSGVEVKNSNPNYLDHIFVAVTETAKSLLSNIRYLDEFYNGEEMVLEIDTSS